MVRADTRIEPGHLLDERYLLGHVIGQGGMGIVFAARHVELDERVAVKVLQPESALVALDTEQLERFLREARLAAKIKNEHVVRVFDVARGKNGAPPYIVMELLDGTDLGRALDERGKLPIAEAVGYILQACEAVGAAHALGIVHRDLKSSNLHLGRRPDGSSLVKVLDFGISKILSDDASNPRLTATSSVFGSPAYMSPEQIRSAKYVDARTDVWALACVFYELITAELPFHGTNTAEMLSNITNAPHIPLRKFTPDVPDGLELVIRDAFVKDPAKRTPSVAALAAALAPFGDASSRGVRQTVSVSARNVDVVDATVRALPPSFAEPPPKKPAFSARAVGIGVALGVALVGVLVATFSGGSEPSRAGPADAPSLSQLASPPAPEAPPMTAAAPPPPEASGDPAAPTASARAIARPAKPRPSHPAAAQKPSNGTIDFSQRQ